MGAAWAVFLGEELIHTRDYSDDTARVIDKEISRMLGEQADRARQVLEQNRGALDAVASALASQETLDGSEVKHIIEAAQDRTPGEGDAPDWSAEIAAQDLTNIAALPIQDSSRGGDLPIR